MIKNIEHKIKLSFWVAVIALLSSVVLCVFAITYSYNLVKSERENIYVLDNGVPLLVTRTDAKANRDIEYRATINTFHQLFFTLPPDDDYIEQNVGQAMYLVDNTGLLEYNNLKEKGYYSRIMSSSAVLSIKSDSIVLNMKDRTFDYYAKQRIDRRSKVVIRELHTSGGLQDVARTVNNPFGTIITDWRTISNEDIYERDNRNF